MSNDKLEELSQSVFDVLTSELGGSEKDLLDELLGIERELTIRENAEFIIEKEEE